MACGEGTADLRLLHLASWLLGVTPTASRIRRAYALLLFVLVTVSSISVLKLSGDASQSRLHDLGNNKHVNLSVGYIFDVIARSARVISYVIIHILSYKNEYKFQELFKVLCNFKCRLKGTSARNHGPFLFTVVFTMLRVVITLYRLFIIDENNGGFMTILSIPYHFKFIFNVLMELQLFTVCSELRHCFEAVNDRLGQLRKSTPTNALTSSGNVLVDGWRLPQSAHCIGCRVHRSTRCSLAPYPAAVRGLRRTHAILCDLVQQVNLLFGVRLLVDISAQLTALMLRLKMLVSWLFDVLNTATEPPSAMARRIELERALSALLLCPIHVGTVFAVVFFCARTAKETEKTTSQIHTLLNRSLERESREELQIFTLQLMQSRVQFTAAGVFPLDFSLLYSLTGVVMTYLVILVQFGASLSRTQPPDSPCTPS